MLMYEDDVEHWHNNNKQLNDGEFVGDARHKQGAWDRKLVHFSDVESVMLISSSRIVW